MTEMKRSLFLGLSTGTLGLMFLAWACSSSEVVTVLPEYDATTPGNSDDGGSIETDAGASDGSSTTKDGSAKETTCSDYSLDAGNPCGAMAFGNAAVPFTFVDPGDGGGYQGGTLVPGIYDATLAERASGSQGSWRETFVLGCNGAFTRIRQIDTGSGPGNISYRAGKLTMNGATGVFNYSCYVSGDAGLDAGPDNLPTEIIKDKDGKYILRYGAAFIRVTLKRRDD